MPLLKDKSDASFKTNVRTLMGEIGKSPHVQSRSQALAVAFSVKRRGRAEGGRAFSIRSLPPNQLAIDAGVDTVGLRRGPMFVTTKDRLEPLDEDYNFGRAARAISSKINPEAFEEAVRNMPMSTNIEDRRGEPTRADPIGKLIERFGSGNGMAEGQQPKIAGFAEGGAADDVLIPPPRNPARMPAVIEDVAKGMTVDPLTDAYRAVRGQMTPDEAQSFALSAAMGLVSPMARGVKPAASYYYHSTRPENLASITEHGLKNMEHPRWGHSLGLSFHDTEAATAAYGSERLRVKEANLPPKSELSGYGGGLKQYYGGKQGQAIHPSNIEIKRNGEWVPLAEGQQMKQAGFAQGGPPKMSVTAPYYARAESRSMLHSGPINSMVPGRTDRHNVTVGSGSYVIPSDTVSHLGQNNTQAGQAILHKMFSGGPYGSPAMKLGHGPGAPRPPRVRASGGGNENEGKPVPIVVAGGEYTVPENVVKAIGGGDIAHGHKILDAFVLSVRKKHIKTLRDLPPPAKS